jgi:hypothetical protein
MMASHTSMRRIGSTSRVFAGAAVLAVAVGTAAAAAPAPSAPPALLLEAPGAAESGLDAMDRAGKTLVIARGFGVRGTNGYQTDARRVNTLEVWDVGAAAPRLRVTMPGRMIALRVLADETRAAVGFLDHFDLVDLRTGGRVASVPFRAFMFARAADGTLAAASGEQLLIVAADGRQRWRATLNGETWGIRRVYTGPGTYHTNDPIRVPVSVTALAFAPDGSGRLAVGCNDGSVRILTAGKQLSSAAIPPPSIAPEDYAGAISPMALIWRRDAILALYGWGQLVRFPLPAGAPRIVHDGRCTVAENDRALAQFGKDRSESASLNYCQGGRAVASPDGSVFLQAVGSGLRLRDATTGAGVGFVRTLATDAVVPSDDGRRAWFGHVDGGVYEQALVPGAAKRLLSTDGATGTVKIAPGRDVVTVFVTDRVATDPDTWWPTHFRTYHLDGRPRGLRGDGVIVHVAAAADRALVQELAGNMRLTDLEGNVLARPSPPIPRKEFSCSALSADGRTVALAADDHLFVFRPDGGAPRAMQPQAAGTIDGLAFNADASRLFVRRFRKETFDFSVAVIEIASGRVLFEDATRWRASAISADGRSMAYAGQNVLVVRDVDRKTERGRLPFQMLRAEELAFIDAETVVFADDESVKSWHIGAAPVSIGPRGLSPDISGDGALALVDDRDRGTHVLGATGLRVTVHALVTGGFAVMSPSGAIGGTDDVRAALVTRRADGVIVAPSAADWPRILTPGLLSRACAAPAN